MRIFRLFYLLINIFILQLIVLPEIGFFPRYPQSNLPFNIKSSLDQMRTDLVNGDVFLSLLIFLILLRTDCISVG